MRIGSFEFNLRLNRDLVLAAVTVVGSVAVNVAAGCVAGLIVRYLLVRRQGGATDGER
ncbi:MAG: hypothetical protein KAX44_03705 [Candidatus Brocadiae bacterium]|nr:hypothetical protein [Candidatus Brocadiia bacterium]